MLLYSLIKRKNSEELHLFISRIPSDGCIAEDKSICKKMNFGEKAGVVFSCRDENEIRKKAAELGRRVCGTCISKLYNTYE